MAISFGYEFIVMKPPIESVFAGTVVPWCSGCGKEEIITAISIIGAVIMPHNFYLHSALVKGGIYLGCQFGLVAMLVWGIGILAAGQSSTMTGTYTGQFVMEGFIKISWPKWKRVLVTRAVAITPTLILCISANGIKNLTGMNDFLNCVQMVQLPFAIIPMITFTSSEKIMHNFKNSKGLKAFALISSVITIGINVYFIIQTVSEHLGTEWYIWIAITPITIPYVLFVAYLSVYCLVECNILSDTMVSQQVEVFEKQIFMLGNSWI
ncbi:unnamed protein product [Caenorhabditis sp. 36 PRJEB53466]|nr:unnamed protein product [Caenorhabditis sp. 36 PRJEB53466]